MRGNSNGTLARRIIDVVLTVLMLCLMAYQVTGTLLHEWIGIAMTLMVIIHQILNRKWYGAFFKGKYNAYRIINTILTILVVLSFAFTAVCGMSMSTHAVPFLYGILKISFARRMHLSMSVWSFILMGLHLGVHIPAITAKIKMPGKLKTLLGIIFCALAGTGLFLFLRSGMTQYMFFRSAFAFFDYERSGISVFGENILIMIFWVFTGTHVALLCRKNNGKEEGKNNTLISVIYVMATVILGLVLHFAVPSKEAQNAGEPDWNSVPETSAVITAESSEETSEITQMSVENTVENTVPVEVDDGFILVDGGTFTMGSPVTENWRIEDEVQHEVTVSSLYVDPYETTQEEYTRLMGTNPSSFEGEDLPVENISWFDAIAFANAKSIDAGLTPVYKISGEVVTWDMSANGYRLPTEAEWEFFCRAGTQTPFNTEHSLDAEGANFYGHYPYEIEENYFDDSVLEARPGEYRQTTIAVGSFEPNNWGLYDCHGNVNEWCWDYYGDYSKAAVKDPAGPDSGTRHVYRGGGWNDFAKNMRSAYRAAGQADLATYNLGIRLVRNAGYDREGIVTAGENVTEAETQGKILIVYFSWGGNTRGIAEEIQRQTGADIFEITLVHPYSTDYETVLMEAQEDQHNQARPEIENHIPNMDEYDIIVLGYPNWWASIPMPIATFLEEYDFTGKTIIPFCSHGGGRFGQSLTAIAKLVPEATMGEGLSVHYSGGSDLPEDVEKWLDSNGIKP